MGGNLNIQNIYEAHSEPSILSAYILPWKKTNKRHLIFCIRLLFVRILLNFYFLFLFKGLTILWEFYSTCLHPIYLVYLNSGSFLQIYSVKE